MVDNVTSTPENEGAVKQTILIPSPLPCTPPVYLRPWVRNERFSSE